MLFVLALKDCWAIEQVDIVAAYLISELKHDVYLKDKNITGNKVWKLKKALYGLKQSGHKWNQDMISILGQAGLTPTVADPGCFQKTNTYNFQLAAHVDDLFIIATTHKI